MYYLGELARKPCVEQEILGSNPVVSKKFFNVRHLLSRFFHPGQKPREAFVPEALSRFQNRDKSQFGTGTKGQICSSGPRNEQIVHAKIREVHARLGPTHHDSIPMCATASKGLLFLVLSLIDRARACGSATANGALELCDHGSCARHVRNAVSR